MEKKDWVKAENAVKQMRTVLNDPNIPKNYTSVYNKEFYEKAINENTKKIERILEDMK